jgi:molybdenum cofactor cytidylyltransferase
MQQKGSQFVANSVTCTMSELPTLIILADTEHSASSWPDHATTPVERPSAVDWFGTLESSVRKGLSCGMQVMVVAPPTQAEQARGMLPHTQVLELPHASAAKGDNQADHMTMGVSAAVIASAQSTGWLLLPANMPLLRTDTLVTIGRAIQQHPVAFPEYRSRRGHPIGFSAELFSELIRLQRENDLKRLITRYPARAVEVDDAGILMRQAPFPQQTPWRVEVQGHPAHPGSN